METISWVGPGAKKLVGESHRRNHIETLGVAAEPGTFLGFLPLHSVPLSGVCLVDDHKWESLCTQVPTHAVCSFALSFLELTVQSGGGWESFRYFFSHPHLFLYLHPIPILCKH